MVADTVVHLGDYQWLGKHMDTSCKLNRFGNCIFNFENTSLGVALKHIVLWLIRINKSISIFFYFSLKFKKTMIDGVHRYGRRKHALTYIQILIIENSAPVALNKSKRQKN